MGKKRNNSSSASASPTSYKWWWCGIPIAISIYIYHYESSMHHITSMHQLHASSILISSSLKESSPTNTSSSQIDVFTDWFKKHGGISNNISIDYFDGYGHGIKSSSLFYPWKNSYMFPNTSSCNNIMEKKKEKR